MSFRTALPEKPRSYCRSNLVLGANDTVPLTVAVRNEGEPAYLCQMVLVLPDDVFMAEVPTGCTLDQQRLECLVGNSFTKLEKVSCSVLDFIMGRRFVVGCDVQPRRQPGRKRREGAQGWFEREQPREGNGSEGQRGERYASGGFGCQTTS